MKRTPMTAVGVLLTVASIVGCSATTPATSASQSTTSAASAAGGVVLPVETNPITNTATAPTLKVTYTAVEDNVDPATGEAIDDRLELTLSNTGKTPLDGLEVYYEMTDIVTDATEAYYQKLDGVVIPPGADVTVYFDNMTDPGHFPENQFSIYRTSTNQVDFAVQVSANGAKIATATATKATGTGEKVD